ncbi:MAG: iron-containing alcohol dehydrogenase, partial [Cellulomonadaceae bacterium]|nr:iron-containing alcohol dehydrogenase [Cellulomonadaceae bacterium]
AVAALTRDLGNPTSITAVGATEADVPALAKAAFEDVCAGGNPRPASVAEIEELFRSLL